METGGNNLNPDKADEDHSNNIKPEDKKIDPPSPPPPPLVDASDPVSGDSISNSPTDNLMDSQIENVSPKSTDQNDEVLLSASPPHPEEIHLTLEILSPDIDQFLSTLSHKSIVPSQEVSTKEKQEEVNDEEGDGDKNENKYLIDQDQKAVDDKIKNGEQKPQDDEPEMDNDKAKEDDDEETKEKKRRSEKKISSIEIPDIVNKFVDLVEAKITERDSLDDEVERKGGKWCKSPDHDSLFLKMVDRLTRMTIAFNNFRSDPIHAELVNRIGSIHHRAMCYLEDEFRFLLEEHYKPVDPDSPVTDEKLGGEVNDDDNKPFPETESKNEKELESPDLGYPEEVVSNLCKIGKAMITAGYESECSQVYMIIRRRCGHVQAIHGEALQVP
ncbi:hypothetical protein LINPERHAP2_LOCUS3597 [Linum perenne]